MKPFEPTPLQRCLKGLASCPLGGPFQEACLCDGVRALADRRDISPEGRRRRELFGKLQDVLEREGLASPAARQAILDTLHGRAAETIDETEGHELLWQILEAQEKE